MSAPAGCHQLAAGRRGQKTMSGNFPLPESFTPILVLFIPLHVSPAGLSDCIFTRLTRIYRHKVYIPQAGKSWSQNAARLLPKTRKRGNNHGLVVGNHTIGVIIRLLSCGASVNKTRVDGNINADLLTLLSQIHESHITGAVW